MAVVEVASVAFYAAFLAVGALAAAVAALLGAATLVQALVFLVISIVGVALVRPAVVRRRTPRVVSGAQGMIGQTGLVVDPIESHNQPGHVRIAGESWPAVSADGKSIPADSTVTVIDIQGATLVVQK